MRRIVILIILVFSNILFVKPQSSPLLKYNPSNEVYEYAQLTFTVEDAKVGKPINMVFTNGVQYENITKEFKNYVELYNFIGRIGWSFLTENKSIEKNKTNYNVLFMRKVTFQGRNNQFNQPTNRSFAPDTFRGKPQNYKQRTP